MVKSSKRMQDTDDSGDGSPPASKRTKVADKNSGDLAALQKELCSVSDGPGLRRSSRLRDRPRPPTVSMTEKVKRSRRLTRRRRQTGGLLQEVMQMPIDIFVEITRYLNPVDLLNLARTSQLLRDLLMSKESKSIWREARETLEIPNSPDDLSEPQYADLLFGKGCYTCENPRTQDLYFSLRVRLCKKCAKEKLVNEDYVVNEIQCLVQQYGTWELHRMIWNAIPCYHKQYRTGIYLEHRRRRVSIDKSTFNNTLKAYEAYLERGRDREFETFHDMQVKRSYQITESSGLVEAWRAVQAAKKDAERKEVSSERKALILARLRGLGYSCTDFIHHGDTVASYRRWRTLLCQAKPFTDRGFEKIRPELESILARRRQTRANDSRLSRLPHCMCGRCQGADTDDASINLFIILLAGAYFDTFGGDEGDDEDWEDDSDDWGSSVDSEDFNNHENAPPTTVENVISQLMAYAYDGFM